MNEQILGIHHVTAICDDAQTNLDFYSGVLGLRLVKRTVNFDAPESYHLYYGDYSGRPGTLLTFFAWPGIRRGRSGTGQVNFTAFAIPPGSIDFWKGHLARNDITATEKPPRFGEDLLGLSDPDGMSLELIETEASPGFVPWKEGPIPAEYAIRGLHSVTAEEEGYERTAKLLTDALGFHLAQQERNRFRYKIGTGTIGKTIDLLCTPDTQRGIVASGSVHHVAWRTESDVTQLTWRNKIVELGYNISPVMDRDYFHSIYFREPGGVLFEIATDPPGFTIDEPLEELGTHLKIPTWLEPARSQIEKLLPPLHLEQKAVS
jgi:glyoxalase family protein